MLKARERREETKESIKMEESLIGSVREKSDYVVRYFE